MPLKIYNPIKSIYIFVARLCVCIQVLSKLPAEKLDISQSRDIIKQILAGDDSKYYNEVYSHGDLTDFANKFLVEKTKNMLNCSSLKSDNPKIIIVSHDFSLTGAPKAALLLAKTIKSLYKTSPVILAMAKGEIVREFEDEKFCVFYHKGLPFFKEDYLEFFNQFDVIIANSLLFDFLNKVKDIKTPVIWWSHEIFTTKREFKKIRRVMPYLHSFWGGSPLTLKIVKQFNKEGQNSLILYGLPEINLPDTVKKETDKIVFSLMGAFNERKRQDLLIKAVKKLPENIRNKAVFYIIGDDQNRKYSPLIYKMAEGEEAIKFVDQMPFEQLLEYYAKTDVVLSTSDFDPMPIVVTYGFMFKKLCLCSDAIGTALLMKDKENGLLFKSGDVDDLVNKLADIIENGKDYESVAQKGYNVYKENFSEDIFKTNVKKHIDEAIELKRANDAKAREIKNKYKVSIITASYNYAHFISKTIDSVIDQTYDNWELIIVDDGSKDNSVEVISEYLSNPKIKLYQHQNGENKGLKETVLIGLKHATGDYVAFLESDDYWDREYLFEKVKFVNEHPEAKIISNDIELFGPDYETEKKAGYISFCRHVLVNETFDFIKKQMQKSNLIPTFSCTMIEKNLLEKLNFNTVVPAWLDWWLWRQAICHSDIYFVDKKLTYWQIHYQSYNQGINFQEEAAKIQKGLAPLIKKYQIKREGNNGFFK